MKRGRVTKPSLRVRRSRRLAVLKVLRMLSASGSASGGGGSGGTSPMTADNAIHDFLTTGRTGRRNAMPDILDERAKETTGDLPERLEALTCSDDGAGTSGTSPQANTNQSTTPASSEGDSTSTSSGTQGSS